MIFGRVNNALIFTVPRRGVGARHTNGDTACEKERASSGVVKLAIIVALNSLNRGVELSGDQHKKVS